MVDRARAQPTAAAAANRPRRAGRPPKAIAEYAGRTPWHPGHIAERYGLFTLIVLAEVVLAVSLAVQRGLDAGDVGLRRLAVAGTAIVFALWWLYFDRPVGVPTRLSRTLVWRYGHYLIFASVAAVGSGLEVAIDQLRHLTQVHGTVVGYAMAVPLAVYLIILWLLHVRPHPCGTPAAAFPGTAALVLLAPLVPGTVYVLAALLSALVAVTVVARRRALRAGAPSG